MLDTNWTLHLPIQINGQESNGIRNQVEDINNMCVELQVAKNKGGTIVTAM